ncbi:hypothetical protein [Corynebacterium freiburgense]|uniref:hypothetical protein n=1 Tax=Corynebacterium freiburgense TaxID=556548 RepID=UPI00041183D7|nr:hypothetical protein [Corynebacterium freiburgense]WJZ01728.1 hypothetical protein CFREI_02120 [Corynebacterium freiburgense]
MWTLLRTNLQAKLGFLTAWLIPLIALCIAVPHAYRKTYPNAFELDRLAESMRPNLGLRVLYGHIPDPLTIPAFTIWEVGMWVILLGSVMAILLGVSLTRGIEEDGITELVLAQGIDRRSPILAALCTTLISTCVLGLGVAAALMLQPESTVYQCIIAGKCITLSTMASGIIGILCGNFCGTARNARIAAFHCLAIMVIARVCSDIWDIAWLRWWTPIAWRDLVQPFESNIVWPLWIFVGVLAIAITISLSIRRDLDQTWFQLPQLHRTTISTPFNPITLRVRHCSQLYFAWSTALTVITICFFGVTGEMNSLLEKSPNTANLVHALTGETAQAEIYAKFIAIVIGILLSCAAVLASLSYARNETNGTLVPEITTGQSRIQPLLIDWCLSTVFAVFATFGCAFIAAMTAEISGGKDLFQPTFLAIIDYLPGIFLLSCFAIACTGFGTPSIAWIPVATSGFMEFFGTLLELPTWLLNVSVFAWPAHEHLTENFIMLVIGICTAILGLIVLKSRDLHC